MVAHTAFRCGRFSARRPVPVRCRRRDGRVGERSHARVVGRMIHNPGIVVHTAPWVFTGHGAIRHGAVAVAGDRIVAVGALHDVEGDAEVVEWQGALTPGLVNAHTHLQYTGLADLGQTSYPSFEVWSDKFEAAYAKGDDWRRSAQLGLDAVIASGTTVVGDVVTHAEALDVLSAGGVHGIAY